MKKRSGFSSIILILILALILAGCGKNTQKPGDSTIPDVGETTSPLESKDNQTTAAGTTHEPGITHEVTTAKGGTADTYPQTSPESTAYDPEVAPGALVPVKVISDNNIKGKYDGELVIIKKGVNWGEGVPFSGSYIERVYNDGFIKDTLFSISFKTPTSGGKVSDIVVYKQGTILTIEIRYDSGGLTTIGEQNVAVDVDIEHLYNVKRVRVMTVYTRDSAGIDREGAEYIDCDFYTQNDDGYNNRLIPINITDIGEIPIGGEGSTSGIYQSFTNDFFKNYEADFALFDITFSAFVGGRFHSMYVYKENGLLTFEICYMPGSYEIPGEDNIAFLIGSKYLKDVKNVRVHVTGPSNNESREGEFIPFSYFASKPSFAIPSGAAHEFLIVGKDSGSALFGSQIIAKSYTAYPLTNDTAFILTFPIPSVLCVLENVEAYRDGNTLVIVLSYTPGNINVRGLDDVALFFNRDDISGVNRLQLVLNDFSNQLKKRISVPYKNHMDDEIENTFEGQKEVLESLKRSEPDNGRIAQRYDKGYFTEDTLFTVEFATNNMGGSVNDIKVYKLYGKIMIEIDYESGGLPILGKEKVFVELSKEVLSDVTEVCVYIK